MRLKPFEVKAIKNAVLELDPHARIFLFGSRVDETKKGGDIDLLILSLYLKDIDSIQILKRIYKTLEEQKIDIIIDSDMRDPFVKIILEEGIEL